MCGHGHLHILRGRRFTWRSDRYKTRFEEDFVEASNNRFKYHNDFAEVGVDVRRSGVKEWFEGSSLGSGSRQMVQR